MGEWLLSRRDRLIVARHEVPGSDAEPHDSRHFVPGLEFGHFKKGRLPDGPSWRHDAEPMVA